MCHSIAVKTSSKINILLSSSDSSTMVLGIDDEDLNTYKILKLKPSPATIHPVVVEPIFAPRIKPIACCIFITPAPVKASTISESAELLCNATVEIKPANIDLKVPVVYFLNY
jgi:hypothetical protein